MLIGDSRMKKYCILAGITLMQLASASFAYAGGNHSGGHGHDAKAEHHPMTVGEPGKAEDVMRTISVIMRENDDGGMIFEPGSLKFNRGETIRLTIVNKGELPHEFVIDDKPGIVEHKALMEKFPEMEHDDPNAVHLDPGESGNIVWKFTNDGVFKFACLIPGHYDAGMHGDLTVVEQLSKN